MIGIEVFGRSPSYSTGDDSAVRVAASQLRKRLTLYFTGTGALDPVRIEVPTGTYVPRFRCLDDTTPITTHLVLPPDDTDPGQTDEAAPPAVLPEHTPRGKRWRTILAATGAGAACVLIAAFFWLLPWHPETALDQFWSPVLRGAPPVSICAAPVPVYGLNHDDNSLYPVRPEDFILIPNQFISLGDLNAVSRISRLMGNMRRAYVSRIGNQVSFEDLRTTPTVLVGYSHTRWKEVSSVLRFYIDLGRRPYGIVDRGASTNWAIDYHPDDRRVSEDYAIVSRVFHPDTHEMLVGVAGITHYGTEAAADLVTNPRLFADAARHIPAGWQKKNVQIVIYVKVISNSPSSPAVVAAHVW